MIENTTSYVGKIVFIGMKPIDDPKVYSSYYDGEYFCIAQTPHSIHCVKMIAGYGGHEVKVFSLSGPAPYEVYSAIKDDAAALSFADELEDFCKENGTAKKSWCDSVYERARANCLKIRRVLLKTQEIEPDKQTAKLERLISGLAKLAAELRD